ncbi:rho GTPase-activating protein 7-like isoform X1 [Tachyglossus aculeatus]|uniref:rho GTPase-activating protein 7-like isoform X1 n=1 Tax=Tachyglossus aculeatus TaxID=9261 RepID=UPI0018F68539|nr:rho GTPase-activating protein 7-like isoform X1 [Tachyglossus aculeatus]
MADLGQSRLQRSFSEHLKNSTTRAWAVIWKSARERRLSEIEAKEACEWLRAAGFPQYAQLFDDMQFPIDIKTVRRDHEFLDRDAIESLYRRLNTLNKCASMKVEISCQRRRSDESEDEEPCAISTKWAYERCSRRWSRLESEDGCPGESGSRGAVPGGPRLRSAGGREPALPDSGEKPDVSSLHSSSSGDSDLPFPKAFDDPETSRSSSRCSSSKLASPDSTFSCSPSPSETLRVIGEETPVEKPPRARGKSLLRKMEKLRLRGGSSGKSSGPRAKPVISGPISLAGLDEDKLRSPGQGRAAAFPYSPTTCSSSGSSGSSGSQSENSSAVSTPSPVIRVRSHTRRGGDPGWGQPCPWGGDVAERNWKNQLFQIPQGHKPGTFPKVLMADHLLSPPDDTLVNWRTGSFHGCRWTRVSSGSRETTPCPGTLSPGDHRVSIYDNVPGFGFGEEDDVFSALDHVVEHVNGIQQLVSQWSQKFSEDGDSDFADSQTSPGPASLNQIHLEITEPPEEAAGHILGGGTEHRRKQVEPQTQRDSRLDSHPTPGSLGLELGSISRPRRSRRWHGSGEELASLDDPSVQIESQSAVHLSRVQKLALLKLTALMDKYSPSSKQGWNWTVPKFRRKTKTPDYKDRKVFGVPLLLSVQRTSQPLPRGILQAMEYLRNHFLDQVGLFRKSGVKSRILSLREMNEADPANVNYEGQSAFDVADMVKQYFRDLPEPIFTSKLCESFLHIYQYLPKDQHFPAVQAAILLLPDENREALKILLFFLRDVVGFVEENQMTPTNIAVCLAPSLFHLNTFRQDTLATSRSSQRKHSLGKPDQRDLSENLAATQGLAHMIVECHRLFQMPDYCLESQDLRGRQGQPSPGGNKAGSTALARYSSMLISLENSMQDLLRDARDKFKSWVSCSHLPHVELANKKVEDGYPLRLWKASVDIAASPQAVLQRVLREQHCWDPTLQQAKVLETLDEETEIYHYTTDGMAPLPPREYVLLRTWRSDPKGSTCIVAATSVEYEEVPLNGVLAHVFLCQHLIETVGAEKSRVTHVCRMDTRGRTTEWYNRVFGHMCAAELLRIKDSFRPLTTDTKETKI